MDLPALRAPICQVEHPLVRPLLNACAMTYTLAQQHEAASLMLARSSLLGQVTGCCFQRCMGMDALNAVDSVTYEMDQALGTGCHTHFRRHVR